MTGLWLLGYVGVFLILININGACSKFQYKPLKSPLIIRKENEQIFVGSSKHKIILKLDILAIKQDFDNLEKVGKSLVKDLSENLLDHQNARIMFTREGKTNLEADGLWELINTNLGNIKVRISSILADISKYKYNFNDFLEINDNNWGEKNNYTELPKEEELSMEDYQNGVKELALRNYVMKHFRNVTDDYRSSRLVRSILPIDHFDLLNNLGKAEGYVGEVPLISNAYESDEFSLEGHKILTKDQYIFNGNIVEFLNVTKNYLNKNAIINRKLVTITAKLNELLKTSKSEMIDSEVISQYILSLIAIMDSCNQLQNNIELLKNSCLSKKMSPFLIPKLDLKLYLEAFLTTSNFDVPFDIDDLINFLYQYVPLGINFGLNEIVYEIEFPVKNKNWYKKREYQRIEIINAPFLLEDSWVNLELAEKSIVVEKNTGFFTNQDNCQGGRGRFMCYAEYLYRSKCVLDILNKGHMGSACELQEIKKAPFFNMLNDRTFIMGIEKEQNIELSCLTSEETWGNTEFLSRQDYELNNTIILATIPKNCSFSSENILIPLEKNSYQHIDLNVSNIATLTYTNMSRYVNYKQDSKIDEEVTWLKKYLNKLENDFKTANFKPFQFLKSNNFIILQSLQVSIFVFIVIVVLIRCCIKKRGNKADQIHKISLSNIATELNETENLTEDRDSDN